MELPDPGIHQQHIVLFEKGNFSITVTAYRYSRHDILHAYEETSTGTARYRYLYKQISVVEPE